MDFSGSGHHYVTAEGFPDHYTGVTPQVCPMDSATPKVVCHPTNEDSKKKHDLPGNYQLMESTQCMSETTEALKKLNEAPSISSLPSGAATGQLRISHGVKNVGVSSAGSSSLSTAQALLHQSLDSGSLTGASGGLKGEQNQFDIQSNVSMGSKMNTTPASSFRTETSSNTSSKDNSKQLQANGNRKHNSFPASSYLEMTARTNIGERLADFDSITTLSDRNSGLDLALLPPSNDLDRSFEGARREGGAIALPINITNQKLSMSTNEDLSMTFPKTVTKSTQTDPSPEQDQDSCGGAASSGVAVQTMSTGPASSLPSDDTLVRKLKRPIVQWLQRKLETNVGMSWQDLADLHDWDYERIQDFECACKGKSPFCMLLAEPEFQMYRVSDLKEDLERLPRKDILHDLDEVMRRHYKCQ